MRNRLLPVLPALLLAVTAGTSAAQTSLQLRWELVSDSIATNWASSRVQFTLTNRDTKPLPKSGWAIYFSALHSAQPDSSAAFHIQDVMADLHRIVPGSGFAGLAPGASIKIPYLTDLLLNRSFAPSGPYIVFDSANGVSVPLSDYVAAPFERTVGAVTPDLQYTRDSVVRDIPVGELPPVFPTPVQVTRGGGRWTTTPVRPAADRGTARSRQRGAVRCRVSPAVRQGGEDQRRLPTRGGSCRGPILT